MSGLHAFLGARDINSAEWANQNIETQRRVQAKMNAMGIATTISDRSSQMPLSSRNQTQIPNTTLPPKRPGTNVSKISHLVPSSTQTASELRPSNRLTDSQHALRSPRQNLHDPFDTDIEGLEDTTTLSDTVQSSTGTRPGPDPNSRYHPYAIRQPEGAGNEENGGFNLGSNMHILEGGLTEEVDDGNSALEYEASPFVTASNGENFQIQSEISTENFGRKCSAEEISKTSFNQLLQEPFDYDTSSEHLIDEPELANASLEDRLHYLFSQQGSENDLKKQRQAFFSSLSIEGFEECGDLLVQKFASFVHKYKQARQHRRQITRQLEQEIQARESLISRRTQNVDSDFIRLKKAGEDVVKGKVL
ncbi:MAG: hypothetical protein Q9214_004802 [Letrouitia sp. 1 TL-2023]